MEQLPASSSAAAAVGSGRPLRHPLVLPAVTVAAALAVTCGIPAAQHAVTARLFAKAPVDYAACDGCACWDTIGIGPREAPVARKYHHVYWNTNRFTFLMFSVTALHVILCYKATEWLVRSCAVDGVRFVFLALVLLNIYPNFYSWWVYIMYFNEREPMYKLAQHHLYYYVTELVVTGLTLNMTNARAEVTPTKVAIVFVISCSHIFGAMFDQYVMSPLPAVQQWGRFVMFHARNFNLTLPDLLHAAACCHVYRSSLRQRGEISRAAATKLLAAVLLCCVCTQLL